MYNAARMRDVRANMFANQQPSTGMIPQRTPAFLGNRIDANSVGLQRGVQAVQGAMQPQARGMPNITRARAQEFARRYGTVGGGAPNMTRPPRLSTTMPVPSGLAPPQRPAPQILRGGVSTGGPDPLPPQQMPSMRDTAFTDRNRRVQDASRQLANYNQRTSSISAAPRNFRPQVFRGF